jgi:hypothetical protein
MDALRQIQENKSCFDCHEKGTMYTVMAPFFVFICSSCAGIHREMNNKVKGITMSLYQEAEIKSLAENGNKVSPHSQYMLTMMYIELTYEIDGKLEP